MYLDRDTIIRVRYFQNRNVKVLLVRCNSTIRHENLLILSHNKNFGYFHFCLYNTVHSWSKEENNLNENSKPDEPKRTLICMVMSQIVDSLSLNGTLNMAHQVHS